MLSGVNRAMEYEISSQSWYWVWLRRFYSSIASSCVLMIDVYVCGLEISVQLPCTRNNNSSAGAQSLHGVRRFSESTLRMRQKECNFNDDDDIHSADVVIRK